MSQSFAPRRFPIKMAFKAKAKASRSTYLDIGLGHISRLEKLVRCTNAF